MKKMPISISSAGVLGEILAETMHKCANPGQRHGVMQARDAIADSLHEHHWNAFSHMLTRFHDRLNELEPLTGSQAMNRDDMIDLINKHLPIAKAVPSEAFDPQYKTGIWLRGSEYADHQGLVFDCDGANELHPVLQDLVDKHGWLPEPYDAGTLFLYPEVF